MFLPPGPPRGDQDRDDLGVHHRKSERRQVAAAKAQAIKDDPVVAEVWAIQQEMAELHQG